MSSTEKMKLLIMCVWMASNFQHVFGVYTAAKETEIRSETALAASYDPVSRPLAQTEVKVGLHLLAIDELELKSQKFSAAGWLTFEWDDQRLKWDKAAKDDIEYIHCRPSTVWKPEVLIDNALENIGVLNDSDLLLKVKYDGTVQWEPPLLFNTHCEIDITYYPYDSQRCGIEIVSWGYTYDAIKLGHMQSKVDLEDFVRHGEWLITETSLEYTNLSEYTSDGTVFVYPQLEFWITMERRTEFYSLNVIMPTFLLSMLIVLVFIVPVNSGEKLSFVLTVLLSLSVLMTVVADTLPPTSVTTSVLGLYLGIVLVLAGVAVLLTVIILIMFHKKGGPEQCSFAMRMYLCVEKGTCKTTSAETGKGSNIIHVAPAEDTETKSVHDVIYIDVNWHDMALAFDKFCFIVFLVFSVVMNISFVLALTVGGKSHTPYE